MASFVLKGGLYIEKAATDLMIAFDVEEAMREGFLRSSIWPRRNTDQISGIIRQLDIDDMLRLYDIEAGLAGEDGVMEVDFELDTDLTYRLKGLAVEGVIDYVEQAAADPVIDYASQKTQATIFKFFNSLEKLSFDVLRDPAQVPNGRNLTNLERLDNYTSNQSNPILQGQYAIDFVEEDLNRTPNFCVMDKRVWRHGFKNHPYLISRSPVQVPPAVLGAGGLPTAGLIESLWGVKPGAIMEYKRRYNVRRKGETTGALRRSHIGSDIIFGYREDASVKSAGFGYEMAFTGLSELPTDTPYAVLTYEDPRRGLYGSQRVRVVSIIGWVITRARSIYRLTNTVDLTDQNKYFYQGAAVLD